MSSISLTLLSIDAWREPEGGWTWNAAYPIERAWFWEEGHITPRRVLKALRQAGFLAEQSKGRVLVDTHPEICDGWLIEIIDKRNGEPILALSSIH